MKRRDFLKKVPVAGAVTIIGGQTLRAYASSPLVHALTAGLYDTDRVLVIVQLNGGNDGLNTIIPLDQYANLKAVRENILMDENKILKLNDKTGIHPAMASFKELYSEGKLAIIQSVGYPNFNYSHFRATDIWVSGSDSDQTLESGWAGRYLNYEYPNFPVGFPNTTMPDPLAIRVGDNAGLGLQNMGVNMGISINNATDQVNLTGNIFKDNPGSGYLAKELSYIREVQRQADKFGDVIQTAYNKATTLSTKYPKDAANGVPADPGANLGNQLKLVARLISGGLKTRIFWVSAGGFDTHSDQVDTADKTLGNHATLLKGVSDAIYGFVDDIKLMGLENRMVGFTFSEFGRRIRSNASDGTDHGSALPMFVFGTKIKAGIIGDNPIIDRNATPDSNLPMQYDFRSIYASVLGDWFCVPEDDLEQVLLKNFQKLPIISDGNCIPTDVHETNNAAGENMVDPYPNPFMYMTTIDYATKGGHTMVQVFNNSGNLLKTLVNQELTEGSYKVTCNMEEYPAGIYYVRLQNKVIQQVKPLFKVN
ncbi:MAG: DUF1501 domain-containing protein [Bacteroidota bacterium]|nr:DUF1501 domain-containing protein [Bacteroidota bacterium]